MVNLSKSRSAPPVLGANPSPAEAAAAQDDKSSMKDVPIIQPKMPKKQSVDLKLLQRLMDERDTFQISKKVFRLSFSLLCGVIFHFLHYAKDFYNFNLATFACALLAFYYVLEMTEKVAYTNKINVSAASHLALLVNSLLFRPCSDLETKT